MATVLTTACGGVHGPTANDGPPPRFASAQGACGVGDLYVCSLDQGDLQCGLMTSSGVTNKKPFYPKLALGSCLLAHRGRTWNCELDRGTFTHCAVVPNDSAIHLREITAFEAPYPSATPSGLIDFDTYYSEQRSYDAFREYLKQSERKYSPIK